VLVLERWNTNAESIRYAECRRHEHERHPNELRNGREPDGAEHGWCHDRDEHGRDERDEHEWYPDRHEYRR
jgi:hypothetical protein